MVVRALSSNTFLPSSSEGDYLFTYEHEVNNKIERFSPKNFMVGFLNMKILINEVI